MRLQSRVRLDHGRLAQRVLQEQSSGPLRFKVVVDVIRGAKPATCMASRVMPPDGPPPTACQLAALEAWLAEPPVLQQHRADDTSPAEPYLMPPFT